MATQDITTPPTTLTGSRKVIAFIVVGTVSLVSLVGAVSPAARDYATAVSKTLLPIIELITK